MADFWSSLELFSFPLQLRKIRNTSYARSKVSLKLLMPYLRHFKWAICLNIFLSLPHLFLIISSTYSWAMGGLLCSLPVSRACLPPLNTSMCLHNTALRHAGKFLNWVQMNGALSEGLFLLRKICMQVLTSAAVEFSKLFWVDLQTTHWDSYDEASSWWFSDCSHCSKSVSESTPSVRAGFFWRPLS